MLKDLKALNEKRILFFEIGLIIALSLMILLFNWRQVEEAWSAPIDYDAAWERVQTVEDITPPTRQRTFAPPPPNIEISKAPLSGNIETVLNDLLLETELASTEINENEVALPASAFTGESPSIRLTPEESTNEPEVFVVVEDMPQFPGGDQALLQFLYGELRYPAMALDNRIQGVVVVQFIIDEKGKITKPIILRGIGGGCDEEALRVIALMPDWKPGRQRGLAVRVRYNLPIRFELKK